MIQELMLLFLGAAMGGMTAVAVTKLTKARQLLQPLLALVDGDTGHAEFIRASRIEGNEAIIGKGKDARRYILESGGRLTSNLGPFWPIHYTHGWNFRFPGTKAVNNDRRLQYATMCNPWTYAQAEKHNDAQDAMRANNDEDHWLARVAPFALIGLGITMVTVIVLAVSWFQAKGGA